MPEKAYWLGGALLVGVLFLVALTYTPRRLRKPMIVGITFLTGLYFSLEYLVPSRGMAEAILASDGFGPRVASALFGWILRPMAESGLGPDENFLTPSVQGLTQAWQVVAGFTFALGMWNLIHVHGKNLLRAGKNWGFSLLFFIGVAFMATSGMVMNYGGGRYAALAGDSFRFATEGMLFQLDAAMFSLIAFFIISAAYRAFRIRSLEATIMMTAAFLVMLGQVPIGIWLTSWIPDMWGLHNLRLENISYWILTQPNAAAQRGINFGLAVGMLAMGLRIWLSLERGSYFEKEV